MTEERLSNYIGKINLLTPRQFGFQSSYATNLALVALTDKIKNKIDRVKFVGWDFIDFTKAFDSINHDIGYGSTASMQINNPLLLFVQIAVALLPLPVDCGGTAQAPVVNPIWLTYDYDANAASTVKTIDTCSLHGPARTTQHACAGYNAALAGFRAYSGIKLGQHNPGLTEHSSTASMQINNPLFFFVQIIVPFLPLPVDYGGTAQAPEVNPIWLTCDYDANSASTVQTIETCWLHRHTRTTKHACTGYNAALAAFRAPSGIKPGHHHPSLTGHGSTASMQIINPLVFFVQVSKR